MHQNTLDTDNKTYRSVQMDKLYGPKLASEVYDRCEELDSTFNQLVQNYVYDCFWAREGLSIRDKSLVTVVSLTVLKKQEQLKIHLKGFKNQEKNKEIFANILKYIDDQRDNALVKPRDKAIIDLSICIAKGDLEKIRETMLVLLENKNLAVDEIKNIMLHQIVYCGFPCAMNGFAVLQTL